jgi:hypothetical protein
MGYFKDRELLDLERPGCRYPSDARCRWCGLPLDTTAWLPPLFCGTDCETTYHMTGREIHDRLYGPRNDNRVGTRRRSAEGPQVAPAARRSQQPQLFSRNDNRLSEPSGGAALDSNTRRPTIKSRRLGRCTK